MRKTNRESKRKCYHLKKENKQLLNDELLKFRNILLCGY
jgi:hypothetical protein